MAIRSKLIIKLIRKIRHIYYSTFVDTDKVCIERNQHEKQKTL